LCYGCEVVKEEKEGGGGGGGGRIIQVKQYNNI